MTTAYSLLRQEWPEYLLPRPEVKEIWVDGCKYRQSFAEKGSVIYAHAHSRTGVICVPRRFIIRCKNTMLHELAHLIVGCECDHNEVWENQFSQLGGKVVRPFDIWLLFHAELTHLEEVIADLVKAIAVMASPIEVLGHYK